MLWNRSHGVVADTCGDGEAEPGWVAEERIEAAVAAIVQIHVCAAKVGEDEVADGICALDGERVAVEGLDEPRVFCSNEFSGFDIGPELA